MHILKGMNDFEIRNNNFLCHIESGWATFIVAIVCVQGNLLIMHKWQEPRWSWARDAAGELKVEFSSSESSKSNQVLSADSSQPIVYSYANRRTDGIGRLYSLTNWKLSWQNALQLETHLIWQTTHTRTHTHVFCCRWSVILWFLSLSWQKFSSETIWLGKVVYLLPGLIWA